MARTAGTDRGLAAGIPHLWRAAQGSLAVDRSEMLRYLGYRGQTVEPELAARIDAMAAELERTAEPSGAWALFPVDAAGVDEAGTPCIRLTGSSLALTGRDIFHHLKDASYAAVLAGTLGMGSERRLRQLGMQHPLDGALYDAACSSLVEVAVDALEDEIRRVAAGAGLSTNQRFSPGYGDMPLDVQPAVLAALNAARLCGISTTPAKLLMPTKSVTAFIGLFEGEPPRRGERPKCASCSMRATCPLRTEAVA